MANRNDFIYVKQQSKNMSQYIPNLNKAKLNDIDLQRLGFYHLILEKITGIQDASDVQLLIQDQEYLEKTGGIVEKDLGIDAVYINKENGAEKEIMLFKFKYRKEFNPYKTVSENDVPISMKFFQYIKSDSKMPARIDKSSLLHKNLQEVKKCLKSDDIYNIKLFMVTNEPYGFSVETDDLVSTFAENYDMSIESITLDEIVSFIDVKKNKISASMFVSSTNFMNYKIDEKATDTSYICKLSLLDLIRISCNDEDMRTTFSWDNIDEEKLKKVNIQHCVLYDNVRGYLGDTNYNKNIADTIDNEPENFFMFNNGITITSETIVCTEKNLSKKYLLELNDFQIVNGGQTLRSAYNYFLDSSKPDRINKLKQSQVLVRMFKIKNEIDPMKNYIAEFTNSQNAISPIDLKSVSQIQVEIERHLKTHKILYIRKAGDVGDIDQTYDFRISMEKFTQILYSMQGYPEVVSNSKKKLFSKYYDSIFDESNFVIERSEDIVKLYFEIIQYYNGKSEVIYDQKVFYIIYFIEKFNLDINLADSYLNILLKNYKGTEKDTRKLLKTEFRKYATDTIEEYKHLDRNDDFGAFVKDMKKDVERTKIDKQKISITNDPSAPKVQLSDEELLSQYTMIHKEVVDRCKNEIPDFKQNQSFNNIMSKLKQNPKLAYTRKLDPKVTKTSSKTFYSNDIIDEIKKEYIK